MSLSNAKASHQSLWLSQRKSWLPLEPTEKESQEGPTYCDVAPQGSHAFLKSFPEVNSLQASYPSEQ